MSKKEQELIKELRAENRMLKKQLRLEKQMSKEIIYCKGLNKVNL